MATFSYAVRDRTGRILKGKLEGESKETVQQRLGEMGYIIVELEQQGGLAALGEIKFGTGVKHKDVAIFARQFSTMVNAGLSLTKALSILAAQTQSAGLRDVIGQVAKDVESGLSLSDAIARHPKVFPPIFVSMTRAGETGGVLDEVLARVADHLEADIALKAKIKSAMTYPVVMGILVLVVLAAMMIFVVPTFEEMFESMGGELPFITRALIIVSDFVASWSGLIALIAVVALIWLFRVWSKGLGKPVWDAAKLNMPIFGSMVRKIALARFTRTFGTLVAAGVPILTALDIVADTSGNEVVARAVRNTRSAVKEGEAIATPLEESSVFPPMLVQMVAVGEETGALDEMLEKVAQFYDEEVATATDSLTSIIEPLMMASLGAIVGTIVVALYMPMFQVITLID
ncbi:MAG: type II secretion system F family protein [Coriobacteriia bacterium]|jgi:type IV pilus assembly protein PilC|nr:type II secretion system F family protein [Coriobacteriia bacterium]